MQNPPKLPVQFGCGLAFTIAATLVAAIALGASHIKGQALGDISWESSLPALLIVGAPFGVLAAARTRDWLAWIIGVVLTVSLWGWYLYDLSRATGVNFLLGFILFLAPLAISGICLATAGMRGRIPDWGMEPE